jgi:hypothetical protein
LAGGAIEIKPSTSGRRMRGGEVDTIYEFKKEVDALQWIKEKSQAWLINAAGKRP